jgi:hypothetical protein
MHYNWNVKPLPRFLVYLEEGLQSIRTSRLGHLEKQNTEAFIFLVTPRTRLVCSKGDTTPTLVLTHLECCREA